MEYLQKLGMAIQQRRLEKNLSVEKLAVMVRRHPNFIRGLEKGIINVSPNTIEDILKILDLSEFDIRESCEDNHLNNTDYLAYLLSKASVKQLKVIQLILEIDF